jgi:ATP-dependent exoDNAse (exonuclease V) alpha subunit
MVAADADTVRDLNARAQAWRVRVGQVAAEGGVRCGEGTVVGVGDVVVTRLNVRALSTGRGWVKNGDDWVVNATGEDGSLRVSRPGGGPAAFLPAGYVREHVELGYASTAHRAQGRTVDTAHAYVTAATLREPLYVMASRGRESNRFYIDVAHEPDSATSHGDGEDVEPVEVLQKAIATSGADLAAHVVRRQEQAVQRTERATVERGSARHTSMEPACPSVQI